MYGLFHAKSAIRKADEVILVDRITDVLAMHQAGFKNAVACVGVALTPEQVQLLKSLTKCLVLVHDSQPAVIRAAMRMTHTALAGGMRVSGVRLPQGVGPAGVIAADGAAEMKALLRDSRDNLIMFIRRSIRQQKGRLASDVEVDTQRAVAMALVNVEDPILQRGYVGEAAGALAIEETVMQEAVVQAREVHTLQVGLEYFQDQLMHTPGGRHVRLFLKREHGLHAETVHTFGLGYAPDSWDGLKNAARARGIGEEALLDAGLLRAKEREEGPWYYDRFRDRIIFPVVTPTGRVVYLLAERLSGASGKARYAKHPEESGSGKGDHLYGLYQCKAAARKGGELLLVNDYRDVLALHAVGIAHAVAPLGGKLTSPLARQISAYVPRIVLVYEQRAAHPESMLGAIDLALSAGLGADVLVMPGGSCRSFIRERGGEAFQAYLQEHRRDLVQVVYEDRHKRGLLADIGQLDQVRQDVAAMLRRIADTVTREHYEDRAATIDRLERTYDALAFASSYFRRQLSVSPEGREAAQYLARRGLSSRTIEDFGLGYAPDSWDGLLKAAQRNDLSPEMLERAGLIKPAEEGKRRYDRFRGRVMFPIHSAVGDIIGFGGRVLKASEYAPKYLNTPETPVYKKSRALYGLYQSITTARKRNELILVEGYTDVLALHQAGLTNAVACCGTALTSGQISELYRHADRLLLLYDADNAGAKAALRAIDLALEGGMVPFAATLPEGEDPDSYVRSRGAAALRDYLEANRREFVEFLHDHFARQGALETPEGKADASHAVLATIEKVADEERREGALKRASEVFNVPLDVMRTALVRKARPPVPPRRDPPRSAPRDESRRVCDPHREAPRPALHPAEEALLEIMVKGGEPMICFIMGRINEEVFTKGLVRKLASLLVEKRHGQSPDGTIALNDPELDELISTLKEDRQSLSPGWTQRNMGTVQYNRDQEEAARSAIRQLKRHRIEEIRAIVQEEVRTAAAPEEMNRLLRQLINLNEALRDVDSNG